MGLVRIEPPEFDVTLDLVYARTENVTGSPIYATPICFLHQYAAEKLKIAIDLADKLGYRLHIFDALRPTEGQWALWNACPDPEFVSDPRKGGPHSRGIAIDLTLAHQSDGSLLDMGTGFDSFEAISHHGVTDISAEALRNRTLLMGIMTTAGWDFYKNEWWHYQLFEPRSFPVWSDKDLPQSMMTLAIDTPEIEEEAE